VQKLDLDACRPAPVSIAEKMRGLHSLPAKGLVTQFGRNERRKLAAVEPVLRANERIGIYEVRVISVPQAWTGLHERAVLLISLPALRLLTAEEVAALVAHEIGHEYVWRQYADAKRRQDARRLRELELVCDAIAIRTLARLGMRADRLQTAVEKTSWYNRERLGVALNEGDYPSLKERKRLLKKMSLLEK
jgi:Zn-dependent protease with chaperone function